MICVSFAVAKGATDQEKEIFSDEFLGEADGMEWREGKGCEIKDANAYCQFRFENLISSEDESELLEAQLDAVEKLQPEVLMVSYQEESKKFIEQQCAEGDGKFATE